MGELRELTREELEYALAELADVANRKTRETEQDHLTGLLSRQQMSKLIEQALNAKDPKPFGIMFLDLDKFKRVNDDLGHSTGDELLKLLAKHLKGSFTRESDRFSSEVHAGRLAGDEFIIFIDLSELGKGRVSIPEEALASVEQYLYELVEQFIEDAIQTLQLPAHIELGASIGSELFDPANPKSAAEILDGADQKMYEAKRRRKGAR
jgi:diguanylate cyclase (GGDEF)-like protein